MTTKSLNTCGLRLQTVEFSGALPVGPDCRQYRYCRSRAGLGHLMFILPGFTPICLHGPGCYVFAATKNSISISNFLFSTHVAKPRATTLSSKNEDSGSTGLLTNRTNQCLPEHFLKFKYKILTSC